MATTKLLTIAEAAELLRCHKQTLLLWLRAGRLPGCKLPGGWRLSKEKLLEHLHSNRDAAKQRVSFQDEKAQMTALPMKQDGTNRPCEDL